MARALSPWSAATTLTRSWSGSSACLRLERVVLRAALTEAMSRLIVRRGGPPGFWPPPPGGAAWLMGASMLPRQRLERAGGGRVLGLFLHHALEVRAGLRGDAAA